MTSADEHAPKDSRPEEGAVGRICVLGHHELDYPRNVVSQRLIRRAGYQISLVHSRAPGLLRVLALLFGYLGRARSTDAVFITEGGHRYVPLIKLVAALAGRSVIFDAFTSRYGTYVEDRKTYAPRSLGALRCWWQDWSAVRWADHRVFDTSEHRDYFRDRYHPEGPSHVVEVGVDEAVFRWCGPPPRRPDGSLHVLFYGTYIPLQGVQHIVEAAVLLRAEPSIRFTLVGSGQTRPEVERRLAEARLDSVTLVDPMSPAELVGRMQESDVCLGIFGDTVKAGNVVPNKVVQAAAVGRPLVTRRSAAVARYFEHGRDALLVEPADPAALAAALVALRDEPERRAALADGARRVFEEHFSERALTDKMRGVLEAATRRRA